jgi:hypothetical protein
LCAHLLSSRLAVGVDESFEIGGVNQPATTETNARQLASAEQRPEARSADPEDLGGLSDAEKATSETARNVLVVSSSLHTSQATNHPSGGK